jgi:hypothetical protein
VIRLFDGRAHSATDSDLGDAIEGRLLVGAGADKLA